MSITRRRTACLTGLLTGITALLLMLAPNAVGDSDWPPSAPALNDIDVVHLTE